MEELNEKKMRAAFFHDYILHIQWWWWWGVSIDYWIQCNCIYWFNTIFTYILILSCLPKCNVRTPIIKWIVRQCKRSIILLNDREWILHSIYIYVLCYVCNIDGIPFANCIRITTKKISLVLLFQTILNLFFLPFGNFFVSFCDRMVYIHSVLNPTKKYFSLNSINKA